MKKFAWVSGESMGQSRLEPPIFVLVLVVLESGSLIQRVERNHSPGGEPLCGVASHLATFVTALVRPKHSFNRRLPGTTQRIAAHPQNANQ